MRPGLWFGVVLLGGAVAVAAAGAAAQERGSGADWPVVGGEPGGSRYSRLTQINRQNVRGLEVAWTFRTGDASTDPQRPSALECTPVVVDGTMYVTTCSPRVKVLALDAATGRERWRFDPFAGVARSVQVASGGVNRGVAFWRGRGQGRLEIRDRRLGDRPSQSPISNLQSPSALEERVFIGTGDGRLISLVAGTGAPDPGFGERGVVDLRVGLEERVRGLPYGSTSAPAVCGDVVVLGFSNSEGPPPGAPGDVRAFDVRTGREVWRFRTVPRPGEFGHETWPPEAWRDRPGANAWSGFTVDAARGIVFCATGSAGADFWGGDRKGDNLFANCVLALDGKTGRRLWHFQTVRHDLWDYDNPCPPVLCQARREGRTIDAVAQLTKTGFCFVLDRLTGKPLFPVEERRVPLSEVPGEHSSPVQIFPLKPPPLARQTFGPEEVTDISPAARAAVLERLKTMHYGPIFTPTPVDRMTVRVPGFFGGATWSGGSFDPTTNTLYANTNEIPRQHHLVKAPEGAAFPYRNTGYDRFTDAEGYPAIKPPWGRLNAIDLNRGEFAWRSVLGEYPELTAKGVPQTGVESIGGTIVTAGGLVFVGGTKDERFRAFDKTNGRLLWEHALPAAGHATPCTYSVGERQFVVIAAGGGRLATKSGDAFVAFALREVKSQK